MPKIQLALDVLDQQQALDIARICAPFVDILEAGTPLIKSVGIGIVTGLKSAHPDKVILADLKTSDVGAYEANMACKAGADIVTTQGITTTATILEVHRESARWKKRAEVDLTGVTDPVGRARELQALGIDLVVFHRSIDQELTEGALWDEQARRSVLDLCALGLDVAVAGGLSASVMPLLSGVPIFAIVVGRGITAQREPAQAAREIEERVRQFWPG